MKRTWASQITLFVLLLAVFFCAANIASACPTCKDAVAANDPEHAGIVKGYFYSILFMMGMPYAIITCFGLYMWRQVKRARLQNAVKDAAAASGVASSPVVGSELADGPRELVQS